MLYAILNLAFIFSINTVEASFEGSLISEFQAYRKIQVTTNEALSSNRIITNNTLVMAHPEGKGFYLITEEGEGYFVDSPNPSGDFQIVYPNSETIDFSYHGSSRRLHPFQGVYGGWEYYYRLNLLRDMTGSLLASSGEYEAALEELSQAKRDNLELKVSLLMNEVQTYSARLAIEDAREHLLNEIRERLKTMVFRLSKIEESWETRWQVLESSADQDLAYKRWSPVHLGGMRKFYEFTEAHMQVSAKGLQDVADLHIEGVATEGLLKVIDQIRIHQGARYQGLREKYLPYNDRRVQRRQKLQVPQHSNFDWNEEEEPMIYLGG